MPKAEVGSTKYLNNKLKSKGLQRLRWGVQICEKQCRDENGFKCHTQAESHVRNALLVGEDPRKHISDFSNQFQRDFLQLLRTSHVEKAVQMNHFYQNYIANKEHIHMNATRWPSLTEFAKHLGREGLCRVEDTDKGLQIAWIDNSPEALRRQDAIRKKERQDKGDEEREQKMIREQIARAEMDAEMKAQQDHDDEARDFKPNEGEKIKLSFGTKAKESKDPSPSAVAKLESDDGTEPGKEITKSISPPTGVPTPPPEKVSIKMGMKSKPKNIFAGVLKRSALGAKVPPKELPRKPISEAERIMKEEIERKRMRDASGPGLNSKRPRLA
ncbi:hypothetical protein HO173_000363 [Letharia columbiana]|uniref:DNA/RNA-binding protein Kin17 WH-like domain-containing protein n=1 Tax=Letharia columbiana TaxID=112416 RepID=A0A8H6G6W6_9LECA|nr:uncharacterized protein HO173_000363 [Letharia columbiana]KAF6241652.1 hypothetical protein HO173_000363 [Letharia columbiana]